ncbi:MAG: F0F1 ATP synthase subunit A [Anaerolineales bacterium]
MEQKAKWRFGVNRWFILLFIVLNVWAVSMVSPLRPHIQLPAEVLTHDPLFIFPVINAPVYLTNTLIATLIGDVILLLIGFGVWRAVRSGAMVPRGISGAVEAFIEVLYNLTEGTAGKWAKRIFPYFATITLLVLVLNWMGLIPGVDSIGIFDEHHVATLEVENGEHYTCTYDTVAPGVVAVGGEDNECAAAVVPFVRPTATDLNFTLALALIAVVMVQVTGIQAQGLGYFSKFLNVKTFFSKPVFGVIDFGVGILEMVSEFSKVLSFAFRLFGNVFAGAVLLFVIGTLVPVFAQSAVLMLEFFVGAIQAIVFGLLTMTFMAQATQSHGGHEEAHEAAH